MSPGHLPIHETFRCAACPGPVDLLQSFLHFKDLSLHSMAVHTVALERAVQASTLLPTTLTMFVCKLCPPEKEGFFLTEGQLKSHLVKHSEFFVKRWKEFSEAQCRVCDKVIDQDLDEDHMSIAHPRSLFADPMEIEKDSDQQKISSKQSKCGGIRLKPIDLLLDQSKKQPDKSDCRAVEQAKASPAGVDPTSYCSDWGEGKRQMSAETTKLCSKPAKNFVTKPSEMKPNQLSLMGVKKHVSAKKIKNYFSSNGVLVEEVFTCNGIGTVNFVNEVEAMAWSGKVISIDDCQIRTSTRCHYPAELRENELIINTVPKAISVDDLNDFFSREAFDVDQVFLNANGLGRVMFRTRGDADYWADQAHKFIVRGIQLHIWRPEPSNEISEPKKEENNNPACSSSDQGKVSKPEHYHMRDRSKERVMNYRGWSEVDNERKGGRYGEGHRRDRSRSRHNKRHRSRSRDSCRSRERSWSRYEDRYRERSQTKYRNRARVRSSSRICSTRERSNSWPSYESSLDEVMHKINKSRSKPVRK